MIGMAMALSMGGVSAMFARCASQCPSDPLVRYAWLREGYQYVLPRLTRNITLETAWGRSKMLTQSPHWMQVTKSKASPKSIAVKQAQIAMQMTKPQL
jgi:hypothetical protein